MVKFLLFVCAALSASLAHAAPKSYPEDFAGTWQRADSAQYRLVIGKVAEIGPVKVSYLNPKPINVESATYSMQKDMLLLTIVLRDEGYPGSTYMLAYLPSEDALVGYYQMPQSGQTYNISFQRVKEEKAKEEENEK